MWLSLNKKMPFPTYGDLRWELEVKNNKCWSTLPLETDNTSSKLINDILSGFYQI